MVTKFVSKKLTYIFLLFLIVTFQAKAGDSFRLRDGSLIREGMMSIEVISKLGPPLSKDTETTGISLDTNSGGQTIEIWSYILEGSIGGSYLVQIKIKGGNIINVSTKQR